MTYDIYEAMDEQVLKDHAYAITIAIQTLVEAMGMQAENQERIQRGASIAYPEQAFTDLINRNGCHHNAVIGNMYHR